MFKKKHYLTLVIMITALILVSTTMSSALTASTNKNTYAPGECVVVNGSTESGGTIVSFTVDNPDGSLIALDQVISSSNGTFSDQLFCFPTEERSNFPAGIYIITIKDTSTGDESTINITFLGPTTTTTFTNTSTIPTVNQTITKTINNTVTETATVTVNHTYTKTMNQTLTQTKTLTLILTKTLTTTQTQTHTTTQTNTETLTTTQTVKVTNTGVTAGAAVVALVAGLGAALAVRKG